jgi:Flp pilus assembly protein TadD
VASTATQRELDRGLEAHRAGRLADAEKLYRKVLREAPQQHEALHLLGLVRHQLGQPEEAERLIRAALRVRPEATVYYENLSAIQRSRGSLTDAVETCSTGLRHGASARLVSDLIDALLGLGRFQEGLQVIDRLPPIERASEVRLADRATCLLRLGRLTEATASAEQAVALNRDSGNALAVLADLATLRGDHRHAAQFWQDACQAHPQWQAAAVNRGMSLLRAGDTEAALRFLASLTLPADPLVAAALLNARAAAYRKLNRRDIAEPLLRQALVLSPSNAEYLGNYSDLRRQAHPAHALLLARRGAMLDPSNAGVLNNWGLALAELDRLEEARVMYHRAIALQPAHGEMLNNLCDPLRWFKELDLASRFYRRAVAAEPGLAVARYGQGTYLLSLGELAPGWEGYSWRIKGGDMVIRRPFDLPFWEGQELKGRLLVWGEQGFGDEIIYGSMLPDLARSGLPAIVECDARLVDVFTRSIPGLPFVARTTPPGARLTHSDIVVQAPMGDLALLFRTRIADFPSSPRYLIPRGELVEQWRRRLAALGPGPKIGFAWRSSRVDALSRRFHPPVLQWAPVLTQAGATFVSLQYGQAAPDLAVLREKAGIDVHSFADLDLFNDIEDVLALSAALDLVVATGTTAFTLPAAAGTPVWLAVPESDYFMFGTDRYPWFPSIKVYAHPYQVPWPATIKRIADDLAGWLRERPATAPGSS